MRELVVRGYSLPEAYHKALVELHDNGVISDCPDWNCKQLEASMTMVVNNPEADPAISRCCVCSPESLQQYKMEIINGILDFNIGKGWDYTYHNRMVNHEVASKSKHCPFDTIDQVQFVIDELKRNPSSRRAVIDVRDVGADCYSDDPACLQHIQYFIRDYNKLDCCVLFRSNDATRATFMNCFGLIALQERLCNELDCMMGTFTLRANSFHCYESEFKNLENYVKKIKKVGPADKSITFTWVQYAPDMEASIPTIMEKVRKLRGEE